MNNSINIIKKLFTEYAGNEYVINKLEEKIKTIQ